MEVRCTRTLPHSSELLWVGPQFAAKGYVRLTRESGRRTNRIRLLLCANRIIGNRNLIRIAVAWDPAQALPLWGSFIGYASSFRGMEVAVSVVDNTRLA